MNAHQKLSNKFFIVRLPLPRAPCRRSASCAKCLKVISCRKIDDSSWLLLWGIEMASSSTSALLSKESIINFLMAFLLEIASTKRYDKVVQFIFISCAAVTHDISISLCPSPPLKILGSHGIPQKRYSCEIVTSRPAIPTACALSPVSEGCDIMDRAGQDRIENGHIFAGKCERKQRNCREKGRLFLLSRSSCPFNCCWSAQVIRNQSVIMSVAGLHWQTGEYVQKMLHSMARPEDVM